MKPRVLITGSSGMLGTDLCQELREDCELTGVDITPNCRAGFNPPYRKLIRRAQRFYKCDITKRIGVSNIVAKVKPDIVIHAAAMTDVDDCELDPKKTYKINNEGTKNVAYACKAIDAALIYISTDFVFDGKKKNPYKETDRTSPLSAYADSKLKGEAAVKRILKKYFILRTSWLYGKHSKNFVDTILKKAKTENILKVVDDQVGSPTYTKDLAKAIHVLLDKITIGGRRAGFNLPCGTYHISNASAVSWYDYAKEILKLSKSQTKVVPISSKELDRPAKRPKMSVLDNSKFVKFTGFKMRDWHDALREYITS